MIKLLKVISEIKFINSFIPVTELTETNKHNNNGHEFEYTEIYYVFDINKMEYKGTVKHTRFLNDEEWDTTSPKVVYFYFDRRQKKKKKLFFEFLESRNTPYKILDYDTIQISADFFRVISKENKINVLNEIKFVNRITRDIVDKKWSDILANNHGKLDNILAYLHEKYNCNTFSITHFIRKQASQKQLEEIYQYFISLNLHEIKFFNITG